MTVAFPSIEPTSRSFTAPRWPTSGITSQSGVTTRRLWGSRPSQGQLSISFDNITDADAASIAQAYNSAKGATTDLTLPSTLFAGASPTLTTWLDGSATGAGLKWFFSEDPPTVESGSVPGRSNVRVALVAELRI